MSEWIKCSDRLPKFGLRVLIFDKDGFGIVSGRVNRLGGWYLEGEYDPNSNITHWMPLPEPPK